jgi:hypothetical protein
MMRGRDQEIHVIDLSRFTPLDALYMARDLLEWIFFMWDLIKYIPRIKRLLDSFVNSCIIGYFGSFGIVVDEKKLAESLEHFDLLILPPKLFIDCKIAKSIIRICKDLSKDRIKELMKLGHGVDGAVLYDDMESLEALEVRGLYHIRELRKFLRWVLIRTRLRRFKIGGVNIYDMMVGNWRKLEESVGR